MDIRASRILQQRMAREKLSEDEVECDCDGVSIKKNMEVYSSFFRV